MKLLYILTLILLAAIELMAAHYPISAIPDSLLKNANSVVRYEQMIMHIENEKSIKTQVKTVKSIIKSSDASIPFAVYVDKKRKVSDLKLLIYDKKGNLIKEYKAKHFEEISPTSSSDLIVDGKYKYMEYVATSFPFTYEFSYTSKSSNTAFLPDWHIASGFGESVEYSDIEINVLDPSIELLVDEKLNNYKINKDNKSNYYNASIQGLKALEYEQYSLPSETLLPCVYFGLSKFALEGVKGQANSWEEFGNWYYHTLIKSQNDLTETQQSQLQTLIKDCKNDYEKATAIYDYVQSKSRYVSIQLGIGGWKPEAASVVSDKGYGDCKGLTNLTMSLLQAAGIESQYSVVYAGSRIKDINSNVVGFQGNHVILNLPNLDGEEYWLECTSQSAPFGHIGSFTDGRHVLAVAPTGSALKQTKVFGHDENKRESNWSITLNNDSTLAIDLDISNKGQYFSRSGLQTLLQEDVVKEYKSTLRSLDNVDILKAEFNTNEKERSFEESISLTAANFGFASDNEFYIPAIPINFHLDTPKRVRKRKHDFYLQRNKSFIDHVSYTIPSTYRLKELPENTSIETEFGSYSLEFSNSDNEIKVSRTIRLNSGEYKKELYTDFRNFIKKSIQTDQTKIILELN